LTSNKTNEVATVHLSVNFWWSPNSTLARNLTVIGQKVICIRLTNRPSAATVFGETNELTSIARSPLAASAGFSTRERR
jgi:aspartyl/asparaginyl beta-hydroxylase (cupin superfamily)